jgi:tripartite-type tricarboxylate transporter receptor subunit TctC
MYFGGLPTTIAHVRSGKLRALAVSTAARTPALPDVPALGDVLPGYEASFWGGFAAPAGTPLPIIETLNREINAALADPKVMARLADLGGSALAGSPADFGKHIADETEKWGKVIRAASIKPE